MVRQNKTCFPPFNNPFKFVFKRETERVITTVGSQFTAKRFRHTHRHTLWFFQPQPAIVRREEKKAAQWGEKRCERDARETTAEEEK